MQPVVPEDKKVGGTDALARANFVKLAKRTKVWLIAMSEEARILPNVNAVERSTASVHWLMKKDYARTIK